MNAFYLTLPSDASMNVFPNNTLTSYITRLPRPIELTGRWEVGLVEIQYPHTWYNVSEDAYRRFIIGKLQAPGESEEENSYQEYTFVLPAGYYTKDTLIKQIEDEANGVVLSSPPNKAFQFKYDEVTEKLWTKIEGYKMKVGPEMRRLLGLDNRGRMLGPGIEVGAEILDIDPIHSMYIYCDVLEPRVVGDTMAPPLRVVPISGEHGEMITRTYQNVHYIPIQKKMFQELELNLRTDTRQLIPFERGKVTITLHFRKRSTL